MEKEIHPNRMKYSQWDNSKQEEMEIGCSHWFNTLMSNVNHIGEYMVLHPDEKLKYQESWGKTLRDISKDMMDWHNSTLLTNKTGSK